MQEHNDKPQGGDRPQETPVEQNERHHGRQHGPRAERTHDRHGAGRGAEHTRPAGPEQLREHVHEHLHEHGIGEHGHGEHGNGEHGHGEHVRGLRNFWREWRSERHLGRDEDFPVGQALSPKEMEAWREFFHQSFGTWPEDHWIFGGRRFSPWHQGMDTFNPFVATLLSKGGGLLPLYVLHLIAQQPRYGNEIMDMLAERTNGQWVSNPGAIYPLLTLLEGEGMITGEWEDPTKRSVRIYSITPAGREEVTRIEMIVRPKLEETVQVLQELLGDLVEQPAERAAQNEATPDSGMEAL